MGYFTFENILDKELCYSRAEEEVNKRQLSLDNLERITGVYDTHKWGSDASRKKRATIYRLFINKVMSEPQILNCYPLK